MLNFAEFGKTAARTIWDQGLYVVIPDDPRNKEFADAALQEFEWCQHGTPGIIRNVLEGAEIAASSLNVGDYEGILEVLQNADDASATYLDVAIDRTPRNPKLLLAHDGDPITIKNVFAMVLAFVSTKRNETDTIGKFGVGLKALSKISNTLEVHSGHYHFSIQENRVKAIGPHNDIRGFYQAKSEKTLFVLPLNQGEGLERLLDWFRDWDPSNLLFLKSVTDFNLRNLQTGRAQSVHSIKTRKDTSSLNWKRGVSNNTVLVDQIVESKSGNRWQRFNAKLKVPRYLKRQFKATPDEASLSVAVPSDTVGQRLYADLPTEIRYELPVSVNAPFDPDTTRKDIQRNDWNKWLFDSLGSLLAEIAVSLLDTDPKLAWNSIPTHSEASSDDNWISQRMSDLTTRVQSEVSRRGRIRIGSNLVRLGQICFEVEDLDGRLTDQDFEDLHPQLFKLPDELRDLKRWRLVLEDISVSVCIGVSDALQLFENENALYSRSKDWFVSLVDAGLRNKLHRHLQTLTCIVSADISGDRLFKVCAPNERYILPGSAGGIAAKLGLVRKLDPVYLNENERSECVKAWLESIGSIVPNVTGQNALKLLADDRQDSPLHLEDEDLEIVRNELDALDDAEARILAPKLGKAIEVDAFEWVGGKRVTGKATIGDCGIPASIEKEKFGWALSADKAEGLRWIAPRYAQLLNSGTRGDSVSGARKFFSALGARSGPAMEPTGSHSRILRRAPFLQENRFKEMERRPTALQDDYVSHELDLVIADILISKTRKKRQERGLALFRTLSRLWPKELREKSTCEGLYRQDERFNWRELGEVPCTWLARLADQPWLQSESGKRGIPRELHLRLPINVLVFGSNRKVYAYGLSESDSDNELLNKLGLRRFPLTRHVVDLLKQMRDSTESPDVDQVQDLYRYLASNCPSGEFDQNDVVGDINVRQLRAFFGTNPRRPGLIFIDGVWLTPNRARIGSPIFGERIKFLPQDSGSERLWITLGMKPAGLEDCIAVMQELSAEDEGHLQKAVLIDVFRKMNSLIYASPDTAVDLSEVPLWCGDRWVTTRPVFESPDGSIVDELTKTHPVWENPCSLNGLEQLVKALGIVRLGNENCTPNVVNSQAVLQGERLQVEFSNVMVNLKNKLAQSYPEIYPTNNVNYSDLFVARLLVADGLMADVRLPDGTLLACPSDGHFDREHLMFYVDGEHKLGLPECGGRLVANCFDGEMAERVIPLEWAYLWQSRSDEPVDPINLAQDGNATVRDDALEQLKDTASAKKGRALEIGGRKQNTDTKSEAGKSGPIARYLKDFKQVHISKVTGINKDSERGRMKPRGRRKRGEPSFDPSSGIRPVSTGYRAYSDDDREQLALEYLKLAIADPQNKQMRDLTRQMGVGADASDDLKRFFEVKAHGGSMPDSVRIELSEIERAVKSGKDFYLVVVAGLEDQYEEVVVRFFAQPLTTLDWQANTSVTLLGINSKNAIDVVFQGN